MRHWIIYCLENCRVFIKTCDNKPNTYCQVCVMDTLWNFIPLIFFTTSLYYLAIGQSWLTSWGYTSDLPEDYDKLYALARKGADASEVNYNNLHTLQTTFNVFIRGCWFNYFLIACSLKSWITYSKFKILNYPKTVLQTNLLIPTNQSAANIGFINKKQNLRLSKDGLRFVNEQNIF